MDLTSFVGKDVCVSLYRHHRIKKYSGRLTDTNGRRICLEVDNRSVWITNRIGIKIVLN